MNRFSRYSVVACLMLGMLAGAGVSQAVDLTLYAGMNSAKLETDFGSSDRETGLAAGLGLIFGGSFAFETGVEYASRGEFAYVTLPLLLRYGFDAGPGSLYLTTGIGIDANTSAPSEWSEIVAPVDVTTRFGVGYDMKLSGMQTFIEAAYLRGMLNTLETDLGLDYEDESAVELSNHSSSMRLVAGLRF